MGEILLLWVFTSLKNAFGAIADLKMLSDPDGHTKPQPQSPCTFASVDASLVRTLNLKKYSS